MAAFFFAKYASFFADLVLSLLAVVLVLLVEVDWLAPGLPGDASVNIDWYIENARKAEAAKFDHVFIVDSPYITPDTAPHFLNRLEPLTLLSALAVATSKIGLAGTLTPS